MEEHRNHQIERREPARKKKNSPKRLRGKLGIRKKGSEQDEHEIDYVVGNNLSLKMAYRKAKQWIDKKAKSK